MPRLVALLRGINVGGHRRVPMAELRTLCTGLGFTDVATHVQSGNVVLTSRHGTGDAASRIAAAIAERFGFDVDVVARTAAEWKAYADANPFPAETAAEPGRVLLLVPRAPAADGCAEALTARGRDGERFVAAGDAIWAHFPRGVGSTKVTQAQIDRAVGSPSTARNATTVAALVAMLSGGA